MKTDKKKFYDVKLDNEEKEILDSFERSEWKSVQHLAKRKKEAKKIAANTLLFQNNK